jgi:hypothetical protein
MTTSYPIVAQYELEEPVRQGPLKVIKRRDKSEIPKIKPHEVLIWRVGDRYVKDQRQLRGFDDIVVRASSVSVVSVRPGTEVEVSFRIDSRDASEFTVKATFVCSVQAPEVVVQNGQANVADALMAHLRAYPDIFEIGLKYPITEINAVRAELAANVRAYMARRPPKIPGMEIESRVTVQVETPTMMASYEEVVRENMVAARRQRAAAMLEDDRQQHLLGQAAKMKQVTQDPADAWAWAAVNGEASSPELAERIQQMSAEREQRDQANSMAWNARDWAVEDRNAQWAHESKRDELAWQRTEIESRRREEQENRQRQLEADLEVLKVLGANGHLDTYYPDLDALMNRIHGDRNGPQVTAAHQSALPEGDGPESARPTGQETGNDY